MKNLSAQSYPVNIVLHPSWWYKHEGITFDQDFFYNPKRRVEDEKRMEKALYERWGRFGLGKDRDEDIPWLGAIHLAAGYLVSEMLGCRIEYNEDTPPVVISANGDYPDISLERAFSSSVWRKVEKLKESLVSKYGYIKGDINWSGILNTAMDLEGESVFIDFFTKPKEVKQLFDQIFQVTEKFFTVIKTTIIIQSRCTQNKISTCINSKCIFTFKR